MIPLIGREREQEYLRDCLESVLAGKGSTLFISGEAGIGKTRLVEECMRLAESRGFRLMRGWCIPGSLSSYMPMREALRSGEMEHLISTEAPPRLETVFLITNTGLLISKCEREKEKVDSDIFTGMLTAVTDFIKDSIRQMGRLPEGNISKLGYGNFNISAVHGKVVSIVSVLTGKENEFLIDDMETLLSEIEIENGERIRSWSGRREEFEGTANKLKLLFNSEKYEGIDWARNDPSSKQSSIFENVSRGLNRAARLNPILIFIDDMQWADPSTLSLLHYVARNARNAKVLILGTYRPEDIPLEGQQFAATMQLMNREDLIKTLELRNLKEREVAGIIQASLGEIEGKENLVELLWRESQGNPLFVLELLNLLKVEGLLLPKDEKWMQVGELKGVDIPSRIYDIIARRLARLQGEQRQLLEAGSVIGEVFSSDVLGKVIETKRLELLRMLNDIEKMHRLIESIERKYRFSHLKIREVLYNGLSEELRQEYHLLIGDTLIQLYGESEDTIGDIAYHYYMARDAEKAVPRLIKGSSLQRTRTQTPRS